MSYCRWSTDDFACDLYVYEDTSGGWTIHVAGNRTRGDIPKVEYHAGPERLVETLHAQHEFLAVCEWEPIDLPHAGATFNLPTPGACADKCEALRALGYRFPDYVTEELRGEQTERGG